jgi:hypothetical protein
MFVGYSDTPSSPKLYGDFKESSRKIVCVHVAGNSAVRAVNRRNQSFTRRHNDVITNANSHVQYKLPLFSEVTFCPNPQSASSIFFHVNNKAVSAHQQLVLKKPPQTATIVYRYSLSLVNYQVETLDIRCAYFIQVYQNTRWRVNELLL